MKKKNRIWIYPLLFMGLVLILDASCKKKSDDNNTGWSEANQAYYNNVIALQDKAGDNYATWSQTMDSLEAINKLQQFFLSDPSVTSATIGSQGIAVQYSNGMRGGIFLNPQDGPLGDTLNMSPHPKIPSSNSNEKSLVNLKKVILLDPHYWERGNYTDNIVTVYNKSLPKAGFTLQTFYKNDEASVDRFTELSGYGIIHIYSHGMAWPTEENIKAVYLLTGESANLNTTKKYWWDIINGNITIILSKTSSTTPPTNVYLISQNFITSHNDFSKDTVLFYGGFCYGYLGGWDQIYTKFAKGAYFGADWSVFADYCCNWAVNLVYNLCDTTYRPPCNPAIWIIRPNPPKSYWDAENKKTVSILYAGDQTLILWKVGAPSAKNVGQSGNAEVGEILTGSYTYYDAEGDLEGTSVFKWYRADDKFGLNETVITGATGLSYTIQKNDSTKFIAFAVIPVALTGILQGIEVEAAEYAGPVTSGSLYIGQNYGGGIIFYIDGTGKHGLIAAPSEQSTDAIWGCFGTLIGTSTAFGTGQANTTAIVNGCLTAGTAARICNDLTLNGYSDWFLPSLDELDILCSAIGISYSGYYWSSSEDAQSINYAWTVDFPNGSHHSFDKSAEEKHKVRAVRAF